jgi:glycosyltransferase involved in cell wall biosynthesis
MERFERWVARSARRIIVPSEYLKTVVEAWGVSSDRIQVIYNSTQPLPLSEFSAEQLRETYHLEGKRVLLWYGRCVPWKNGDFLLRVLSCLSDEYRLVMIGDGPSLSHWKEKAEREGLIERVLFLGKQPRTVISAWLRVADAFVLPSLYEGFPHSVVEAVSCGVPVFVSDQCGNPETRQLFGDGVKVLSLEEQVWIEALTQDFSRMPEVDLSHSMRKMLDEYHDVLSRFYDKI